MFFVATFVSAWDWGTLSSWELHASPRSSLSGQARAFQSSADASTISSTLGCSQLHFRRSRRIQSLMHLSLPGVSWWQPLRSFLAAVFALRISWVALVSWAISSSGKACRDLFYGLSWPRRRSYFLRSGFGSCCLLSRWRSYVSRMMNNCLTCSENAGMSCCFLSTGCSKCYACLKTIHCLPRLRLKASRSRRCVAKGLTCACPQLSPKDGVWCL